MMREKIADWGMLLAGVLFLAASLLPIFDDRPMNAAFLAIGVVFLILGAARARKRAQGGDPPPG